jgi:hypothetical protein
MDVLRPLSRTEVARVLLAAAVYIVSVAAAPAAAQQAVPGDRGRFILGLGVGYAATKSDCSNCSPGDEGTPGGNGATYDDVAFVSISPLWRVSAKVVAGAELQFETSREDARVLYVMGAVRYHPWASQGFFLRAGYGLVQVKANLLLPDGVEGQGTYRGVVLNYGVGWELLKGSRVSLAPFGAHYVSTLASVTVGEFQGVSVIGNVWVAGIQLFFN